MLIACNANARDGNVPSGRTGVCFQCLPGGFRRQSRPGLTGDPGAHLVTTPEAAWIGAIDSEGVEVQELERRADALRSQGYRARTLSLVGPLCDELLSAIEQNKVDLIVLGTHGRKGVERLLLGSDLIVMGARPASGIATHLSPGIAAKVMLEAPCPVMTLLQP